MKLLAEDLGFLDAGVKNLLKLTGMPGMDIWQFTSEEMEKMEPEKAAFRAFYTGTHDNDTLAGFVRQNNETYTDDEVRKGCEHIIEKIYRSQAALSMIQIQDMFSLGTEARINVPGIAEGNWTWKMPGSSVKDSFRDSDSRAEWFRELAKKTDR